MSESGGGDGDGDNSFHDLFREHVDSLASDDGATARAAFEALDSHLYEADGGTYAQRETLWMAVEWLGVHRHFAPLDLAGFVASSTTAPDAARPSYRRGTHEHHGKPFWHIARILDAWGPDFVLQLRAARVRLPLSPSHHLAEVAHTLARRPLTLDAFAAQLCAFLPTFLANVPRDSRLACRQWEAGSYTVQVRDLRAFLLSLAPPPPALASKRKTPARPSPRPERTVRRSQRTQQAASRREESAHSDSVFAVEQPRGQPPSPSDCGPQDSPDLHLHHHLPPLDNDNDDSLALSHLDGGTFSSNSTPRLNHDPVTPPSLRTHSHVPPPPMPPTPDTRFRQFWSAIGPDFRAAFRSHRRRRHDLNAAAQAAHKALEQATQAVQAKRDDITSQFSCHPEDLLGKADTLAADNLERAQLLTTLQEKQHAIARLNVSASLRLEIDPESIAQQIAHEDIKRRDMVAAKDDFYRLQEQLKQAQADNVPKKDDLAVHESQWTAVATGLQGAASRRELENYLDGEDALQQHDEDSMQPP